MPPGPEQEYSPNIGNFGGVTLLTVDQRLRDQEAMRMMRMALSRMSGGFKMQQTPLLHPAKAVRNIRTGRDPQLARREEDGNPRIAFLCDMSISCAAISQNSMDVAMAASVQGVRGSDVYVVTHSNGICVFGKTLPSQGNDDIGKPRNAMGVMLHNGNDITRDAIRELPRLRLLHKDGSRVMEDETSGFIGETDENRLDLLRIMRWLKPDLLIQITDTDSIWINYHLGLEFELLVLNNVRRSSDFDGRFHTNLSLSSPALHPYRRYRSPYITRAFDGSIEMACVAINDYANKDRFNRLLIRD